MIALAVLILYVISHVLSRRVLQNKCGVLEKSGLAVHTGPRQVRLFGFLCSLVASRVPKGTEQNQKRRTQRITGGLFRYSTLGLSISDHMFQPLSNTPHIWGVAICSRYREGNALKLLH